MIFEGEETFDISVEKTLWLMASVRDRHLVGKHDTVGRAYICLDPKRFGDFLAHDLWLDLDTQGRLLLRVSMEGEQDDILFFFGRAFRSLKRTEGDMVRIFVDKVRCWYCNEIWRLNGFTDVPIHPTSPFSVDSDAIDQVRNNPRLY